MRQYILLLVVIGLPTVVVGVGAMSSIPALQAAAVVVGITGACALWTWALVEWLDL